jgi:hypothetical protein
LFARPGRLEDRKRGYRFAFFQPGCVKDHHCHIQQIIACAVYPGQTLRYPVKIGLTL